MKNLITGLVAVAVIALNTACKKSKGSVDSVGISEVVYTDYAALKKGNYWIYGRFRVDSDGKVTDLKQSDSCYVVKDTVVRNRTFYKIHKFDFVFGIERNYYVADSLHFLINQHGKIVFSSQDFTTVFNTAVSIENASDPAAPADTSYKITTKMTDKDMLVTVPAGNFVTSNMQSTYLYYPSYASASGGGNPRHLNMRYAKNTGVILETELFYLSAPYITERRLLRYHLN